MYSMTCLMFNYFVVEGMWYCLFTTGCHLPDLAGGPVAIVVELLAEFRLVLKGWVISAKKTH